MQSSGVSCQGALSNDEQGLVGGSRIIHVVRNKFLFLYLDWMAMTAGHFYWVLTNRGTVTSQRMPIGSGTPFPKPVLKKIPLSEDEMSLSLLILEKRYPHEEELDARDIPTETESAAAKEGDSDQT